MLLSIFKPARYRALVLLPFLFFTCSDEPGGESITTSADGGQNEIVVAAGATMAEQFFSATEMKALNTIKNRFEKGLRIGYKQRTVGYAYVQHATRIRLDVLEQSAGKRPYPFDQGFSFAEVEESVKKLPFISHKCGYMRDGTDEVVNYYCLGLDENYFSYLAALPDSSKLIKTFADTYQKQKTITPEIRQAMILESLESLDMDNWDHQLFYLFYQCWLNEELIAYRKVNTLTGPAGN